MFDDKVPEGSNDDVNISTKESRDSWQKKAWHPAFCKVVLSFDTALEFTRKKFCEKFIKISMVLAEISVQKSPRVTVYKNHQNSLI